jgi:hypothetical protein
MLGRGCRVDRVTLSNQILLRLSESSDLCVVLHCHLYNFVHKWSGLQRYTTQNPMTLALLLAEEKKIWDIVFWETLAFRTVCSNFDV